MIATARRRAVRPSVQPFHFPAPVGGLNTVSAGSAMPLSDCVRLYNMTAAEYGLRSRLGSREWCTGLTGAADNYVRSVVPFTGSEASKNKLFACTSSGIWDVTTTSAAPTRVLAFGTTTGDAGWGISTVVVTSAGHFLLYCDEVNGLHVYTESTDTWAAVTMGGGGTQISGVNPANFCFVTAFKSRVWFVEKNTARAWYLSAGAIYGAATSFEMGTKFRAGGSLVGLWNHTYDGGAGMDDSLIAVSRGGDVLVWQMSDPATPANTYLKGVWFVGAVPAGRRIATNYGGDTLVLSKAGAIPMSALTIGNPQYATAKVSNIFNARMLSTSSTKGWSLRIHPEDNALMVTAPTTDGAATEQFAMNLTTKGWSEYRDLPIYSSEVWDGKLYFGTVNGKVCINDGYFDGITLADPSAYTAVQWRLFTSVQNFGNARMKQVQMIRPTIICDGGPPAYAAAARYNYSLTEIATVTPPIPGSGSWDSGLWDSAVWGGDYTTTQAATGAAGMGTDFGIAIRGTATARTILVGIDVMYTQGGLL